ncbi:MAG: hypothetical protein ACRYHA_14415 [Janthinobacterium lividum]
MSPANRLGGQRIDQDATQRRPRYLGTVTGAVVGPIGLVIPAPARPVDRFP